MERHGRSVRGCRCSAPAAKKPDAGDKTGPQGDHVRETRADMLDKARAIEDTVMKGSARERQRIDEQAR
jgi:hypothetical protein